MPYPLHAVTECIDERVNTKVFYERGGPALSRRFGSGLLAEQTKDGWGSQSFSPRRQQAEVAHRVMVPIKDMLRERGNKLRRRTSDFQQSLRSGVFDLVNHFLLRYLENPLL